MKLPFNHFDIIARHYDQFIGAGQAEETARLLAAEDDQWVWDIGGGTGRIAGPLAAAGARVVVLDRSHGMIKEAVAKGLAVTQASVASLPLRDDSVPRLLVVDAFHHFTSPWYDVAQTRAAEELVRVLAPGGRLLIQEPNINHLAAKAMALGERLLLMGSRFLSPEQLTLLFQGLGLKAVEVAQESWSTSLVFVKPAR